MFGVVGSGWKTVWALFITVSTVLLFWGTPCPASAMERGLGDEHIVGADHHDVPMISRQQDTFDRSARRNEIDAARVHVDEFELVAPHAWTAWSLPAATTSQQASSTSRWLARGPPASVR